MASRVDIISYCVEEAHDEIQELVVILFSFFKERSIELSSSVCKM